VAEPLILTSTLLSQEGFTMAMTRIPLSQQEETRLQAA
jgi:hypothetical protein